MPIIRYENIDIYIPNKKYEILYWDEIFQIIKNKYSIKTEEIYDYNIIKDILYDTFNFFCDKIDDLIKKENRFSFYLYCIHINEGMNNIYMKQIKEKHILKIDEQDFTLMRMSLKIIIEQSVKYNLIGSNNFSFEIANNINEYIDYLENQNRHLEELARLQARELSKVTRNIETLNLKALLEYGKVRKEKQKIYYIHYSNLARNIAGIPKGIKRDELTQGQLGILQQVELIMAAIINECMGENIPFVLMYQEVKDRTEIKAKVLLKALQRVENVDNGPVWKIGY